MSSPNLLVVDDHLQMLSYRKAALERMGYVVQTASNSWAAIRALRENVVDAVLVEYKLEGLDAEAIAFHIKQFFPQQAIILLSAYADIPERVLWLVDEYVMRSATLESLVQTIQTVAKKSAKPQPSATRAAAAAAA